MPTRQHTNRLFAVYFTILLVCIEAAKSEPMQPATPPSEAVHSEMPSSLNNYRLLPKDAVHIKVFQEDDLETTTRIGKDGTISFPLLGTAKIGGLTVQEATSTMEKLLHEYLVKPQVALTIVEYSKRRITILGTVGKPGTYDMPDDATVNLLEAIGMAGGFSRISSQKVTVKRMVQGRESIFNLDAKKMQKDDSSPRFEVLPGDTILVGESFF
jgi:protein involved in polysaccharide export with SLBB domain